MVSGSVSPTHIHLVIHTTTSEAFDIDSEKKVWAIHYLPLLSFCD
jgi:predicted neutral ceramidase superfamily lipid hydrolase